MGCSKKIGLAFSLFLSTLFSGMMLSGCPQPIPPPIPGPTPASADAGAIDTASSDVPVTSDPFKGKDFNCHLPIVAAQYTEASPKVEGCLGSTPLACLVKLLGSYDTATVACLVRDLGSEANNAVLAGTASGNDGTVAANARIFINTEDLGFQ
jgi:hypothetical protein